MEGELPIMLCSHEAAKPEMLETAFVSDQDGGRRDSADPKPVFSTVGISDHQQCCLATETDMRAMRVMLLTRLGQTLNLFKIQPSQPASVAAADW